MSTEDEIMDTSTDLFYAGHKEFKGSNEAELHIKEGICEILMDQRNRIYELEGKLKAIEEWNKDLKQHSKYSKLQIIGFKGLEKTCLNSVIQTIDNITNSLTQLLK
jgi:hypothetical protein